LLNINFCYNGGVNIVEIIKKGGAKEQFDKEKIKKSIEKAAIDAGYNLEKIKTLINEITKSIEKDTQNKEELDTAMIRVSVFNKLEKREPSIVESWKKFDEKYKP
jgi:transcriptional regulator NrdR family protein